MVLSQEGEGARPLLDLIVTLERSEAILACVVGVETIKDQTVSANL